MPSKTTPTFLTTARAFYGPAFDHKRKKALARSMAEWAEMDEDEQSFAHAHLLYLNLQAQAATQKMQSQVRDLLDEVAESLSMALEASMPEAEDDDELEEEEDDDGFPPDEDLDAPPEMPDEDLDEPMPDEPDDDTPDEDDAPDEDLVDDVEPEPPAEEVA